MTEVLKAGVLSDEIDLGALAHNAAEQAEEFVRKVCTTPRYHHRHTFTDDFIHRDSGLGSIVEGMPLPTLATLAAGQ